VTSIYSGFQSSPPSSCFSGSQSAAHRQTAVQNPLYWVSCETLRAYQVLYIRAHRVI